MTVIPWRVKNFVSERFPLFYHLAANVGRDRGNSKAHWEARLAESWNDHQRLWPAKNELIASLTAPSDAILDVGCGNGGILRDLKARGYTDLHGMEISEYAIRRLGQDGIAMHFGRLPAIPLPDAAFDAVIASQVLEHIIRRRRFLAEIARVLKPGGQAFIFVPDNCLGPIDESEHVCKYDAVGLRVLLARHFDVKQVTCMRDANHAIPILFAHVRKQGH